MPRRAQGPRLYLYRRKGREPYWIIRDGAFRSERKGGIGERRAAEEALARYIEEKHQPFLGERNPARIEVADVLRHYANTVAPNHACPELVGYHMGPLIGFWGRKKLAQVRGASCREYAAWRTGGKWQGKTVSVSTARRELVTLRAAINAWHRESPLPSVPVVTLPPEAPARQRFLTRSEAAAMIWAARKLNLRHVARMVLIGLYTGTRLAAMLGLHWQPQTGTGWVDLERGIMLRRGPTERETSKRRPPCRIPDRLLRHLRGWWRQDVKAAEKPWKGKRRKEKREPAPTVVSYRGRPIQDARTAWELVRATAGLGPDVTPHVLRHTCASWALAGGMSIWDVAALLGASVSVIEETYGHHSPMFQEAVSAAFQRRVGGRK